MLRYILLFIFCYITFTALAQDDLLRRRVSVNINDQPLESTLMALSNNANFTFSYDATIFNETPAVTLSAADESVKQALEQILPKNVAYKVSGNHLILLRKLQEPQNEKFTVSGNVFDANTGKPLTNVMVYEVSSLVSSMTDADGAFKMSVPVQYDQFGISFNQNTIRDTVIVIPPKDHHLSISLSPMKAAKPVENIDIVAAKPAVESLNLVQKLVSDESLVRTKNADIVLHKKAQISVWPSVGTNLKMGGLMQNSYSLNLFIGYANGVDAFELGGLFNINRKHVNGVQIGGLGNITGGETQAVQISGVFNHNKAAVHGFQLGGVYNFVADSLTGVQIGGVSNNVLDQMNGWQISGVSNLVTHRGKGGQISGVSNFVKEEMSGIQISGVLNRGKDIEGLQLSGVANWAKGEISGVQITGVLNVAESFKTCQISTLANWASKPSSGMQIGAVLNYAQDIKGVQVASVLNIARNVQGAQIGLINIADSTSGVPIGLVSIVKKGGIRPLEVFTNEITAFNIGFRTGVRKFYNIFTAGYGSFTGDTRWTMGYGMGTERKISEKAFVNIDYTSNWVNEGKDFVEDLSILNLLDVTFGYGKLKGLKVIAGPSFNLWLSENKDPESGQFLTNLAPYTIAESVKSTTLMQFWIGGKLAVRL